MKRSLIPKTDEFYVGYLPNAPQKTSGFIKRLVIIMGIAVITGGVVLVFAQREFSTGTFEYGITTTLEGNIYTMPVAHLKLELGVDANGKFVHQNLILVGAGKSGIDSLVKRVEKRLRSSIEGKRITLTGYLIYGDGKALLQVNDESDIVLVKDGPANDASFEFKSLGPSSISGEVVDPKCFFGVMKPAEGKVHRSCAIRCIAGGIQPVFKSDRSDYFLITGENFEPINQYVLNNVGDHVNLLGEIIVFDNWRILKIKPEQLSEVSTHEALVKNVAVMEEGMTFCSDDIKN